MAETKPTLQALGQLRFKITKILATSLNKYLASIIHLDQTGFIPGRLSFSNVRRLLNTIYSDFSGTNGASILSLDAHKAFDQVECLSHYAGLDSGKFLSLG